MAEWKGTNGTSEDPKSAFSDPPVRNRKNRILGGLGVMAVQSFSRIRVRCHARGWQLTRRYIALKGGYRDALDLLGGSDFSPTRDGVSVAWPWR
jgi:hypothetical protein